MNKQGNTNVGGCNTNDGFADYYMNIFGTVKKIITCQIINPAKGYSFKLQFYKQTIVFASVDSALTIIPNNFQITLPNSTDTIIVADFDSTYIGNGTITPLTITWMGQGMQVNNTAVTIDADET